MPWKRNEPTSNLVFPWLTSPAGARVRHILRVLLSCLRTLAAPRTRWQLISSGVVCVCAVLNRAPSGAKRAPPLLSHSMLALVYEAAHGSPPFSSIWSTRLAWHLTYQPIQQQSTNRQTTTHKRAWSILLSHTNVNKDHLLSTEPFDNDINIHTLSTLM